jgi:hypothetical protein
MPPSKVTDFIAWMPNMKLLQNRSSRLFSEIRLGTDAPTPFGETDTQNILFFKVDLRALISPFKLSHSAENPYNRKRYRT